MISLKTEAMISPDKTKILSPRRRWDTYVLISPNQAAINISSGDKSPFPPHAPAVVAARGPVGPGHVLRPAAQLLPLGGGAPQPSAGGHVGAHLRQRSVRVSIQLIVIKFYWWFIFSRQPVYRLILMASSSSQMAYQASKGRKQTWADLNPVTVLKVFFNS